MTDKKTESRPADPYRRRPGVIDLPAREFNRTEQPDARATASSTTTPGDDPTISTEEPPTAIEPVATTGLDGASPVAPPGEATGSGSDNQQQGAVREPASQNVRSAQAGDAAHGGDPVRPVNTPSGSLGDVRPASSGRGFGSLAAAGLIGGIVGAGLVYGAETLLPNSGQGDLDRRLAALETRAPAPPVADPALERRISTLEGQSQSLSRSLSETRSAADAAAKQAFEALNRPEQSGTPSLAPAPSPSPALQEAIDANAARIATIEERVGAAASGSALDDLRTRLAAIEAQAAERARTAATGTQALQSVVDGLTQRIEGLDQRFGTLAGDVAKLPPNLMQAGLRAVVAGQVADALRTGAPLGPAIVALERLGTNTPEIEALRPFASNSAPSAAALAIDFRPVAERITAEPTGPTTTLGDRLLRIADKIVTVKTLRSGSGDDLPNLVGRIEAALARGDTIAAVSAWERLPDESRKLGAEWGERLKRRAAADTTARKLAADALAALDASSR